MNTHKRVARLRPAIPNHGYFNTPAIYTSFPAFSGWEETEAVLAKGTVLILGKSTINSAYFRQSQSNFKFDLISKPNLETGFMGPYRLRDSENSGFRLKEPGISDRF